MDWLTFVVVDPVKALTVKILGYIPSMLLAIMLKVSQCSALKEAQFSRQIATRQFIIT